MIGQYLSNKNKNDTVSKFEIFSELNKAWSKALFSLGKILDFATVVLSFVCGKYYPIID